ncbi:MAG TPA: NRDE family protein [Streptosporangiaceae bacterium]
MCTAVLSIHPGQPLLLAGVRDELTDRAWQPPGRHWPDYPDLVGGRDLQAGGTWLAVDQDARRVACVLNGLGQAAPPEIRRSRGELPLRAAAGLPLDRAGLAGLDPFLLLVAGTGSATLTGWDGRALSERALGPGLHMVVNTALMSEQRGAARRAGETISYRLGSGEAPPDGREHERARLALFFSGFAAAARPEPRPGGPAAGAWGAWFPLVNGNGRDPGDPAALIVRRDLGGGRVWGSTSVSLVALWPDAVRYDFCGRPGDLAAWTEVTLAG